MSKSGGGGGGPSFKDELDELKVTLRLENETYLRSHPELKYLTQIFMEEALEKQPEDVVLFASQFFNAPDLKMRTKRRELGIIGKD